MTDDIAVIVCAGGASWELPLLRGLQRPELGVRVVRRCVDHGELLGTALRDRPRAVVLDAALGWLDRDLVATLRRAGVEVVAVGSPRGPDDLGAVDGRCRRRRGRPRPRPRRRSVPWPTARRRDPRRSRRAGRLVVVWGGTGAPGRTTVAVHLAIESARRGRVDAARRRRRLGGLGRAAARARRVAVGRAGGAPRRPTAGRRRSPTACSPAPTAWPCWWDCPVPSSGPRCDPRRGARCSPRRRDAFDTVVVDVAAPIEEDEELVADRIPFRRNLMTTTRARPRRRGAARDRRRSRSDCAAASSPTGC